MTPMKAGVAFTFILLFFGFVCWYSYTMGYYAGRISALNEQRALLHARLAP